MHVSQYFFSFLSIPNFLLHYFLFKTFFFLCFLGGRGRGGGELVVSVLVWVFCVFLLDLGGGFFLVSFVVFC